MSVPSVTAALLARGVCRALDQLGYASLVEFPLANGRRADVVALGKGGDLVIVEIKSSVADFRADQKWPAYREFSDRLYFAVASGFPTVLIPQECGLMVADTFGAAVLYFAAGHHGFDSANVRPITPSKASPAGVRMREHTSRMMATDRGFAICAG